MTIYNTPNYEKQGGAEWVVGSGGSITVEAGGSVTNAGASVISGTQTVSGLLNVTGTFQIGGSAFKFAAGTPTLGTVGSVIVATGLTTVVGASASLYGTAAPGTLTSALSVVIGSAGTITIYGWKPTAAGTVTMVATDEARVVSYTAIGT